VHNLDFEKIDAVYAFHSAALEILQNARSAGVLAVMEQTNAPIRIVRGLLRDECKRYPSWISNGTGNDRHELEYSQRESEEWRYADIILCGSDFVRKGIIECNGPAEKCLIVPYGVDSRFEVARRTDLPKSVKLRVLTVGAVGLRKGTPYVLQAAKRCQKQATFRIVGSVNVSSGAAEQLKEHVHVLGRVPRSEIQRQYAWADVFLLPSLCEGSATVVYEALAAGLPVICTPNTGSIVRDGTDGFIVPIRDPEAIARCIVRLAGDESLRRAMSKNARLRYEQEGSLDAYARRLLTAISEDSSVPS
jgi:glycosyltransferase involved in cell wall biosynthesis